MSNFCRTKILASIKSLNEIGLVLKKGVDIIDFKDPSVGSLGALSIKQISFFLKSIPSNQLTSATIGDIKDIKIIKQKVIKLSKTSIDFIKIGFFFDEKRIKLLKNLKKLVKNKKCDVGFAFDGDGDRLGVVDNKGNIIWADKVVAFLARDVLKKKPNSKIILDIKTSQVVFDEIKKLKGIPILWKTGHSLIKKKMKEIKSVFAGEMSGHIFFGDSYYGFDDAIYAAIRFLNLYSILDKPLSEILNEIPKSYSTPELRFSTSETEKFVIIKKLKAKLKKEKKKFIAIDGVRYVTKDGWWLARASNTQNIIVARCESFNKNNLKKIKESLRENLKKCDFKITKI